METFSRSTAAYARLYADAAALLTRKRGKTRRPMVGISRECTCGRKQKHTTLLQNEETTKAKSLPGDVKLYARAKGIKRVINGLCVC